MRTESEITSRTYVRRTKAKVACQLLSRHLSAIFYHRLNRHTLCILRKKLRGASNVKGTRRAISQKLVVAHAALTPATLLEPAAPCNQESRFVPHAASCFLGTKSHHRCGRSNAANRPLLQLDTADRTTAVSAWSRRVDSMGEHTYLYVQHGVPDGIPHPPLLRVGEDPDRWIKRAEGRVSLGVVGLAPVQEVLAGLRHDDLDLRARDVQFEREKGRTGTLYGKAAVSGRSHVRSTCGVPVTPVRGLGLRCL